jgi:hypothetical protein
MWRVKCVSYYWQRRTLSGATLNRRAFLRFHDNASNIHWIVDSDTCTSTMLRERVSCISIATMATRTCRSVTFYLHCLSFSVFYSGVCKDLPYAVWDFPNICIPELIYEEERHAFRASMVVVGGCCPSIFFHLCKFTCVWYKEACYQLPPCIILTHCNYAYHLL